MKRQHIASLVIAVASLLVVDALAAPGQAPIRQNAAAVAQYPRFRSHSPR